MTPSEHLDPGDEWPFGPNEDFAELMNDLRPRPEKSLGVVVNPPSEHQVATYQRLVPMLEAAHHEMSELSRKKPDGIVNSLKIRNINRLLTELQKLLANDPSRDYVELLEEDALPQNSDVVLLLSQWHSALMQFKERYYMPQGKGIRQWVTFENPGAYTLSEKVEAIPGFRSSGIIILDVIRDDGGQDIVSIQVNNVPVTSSKEGNIEAVVRTAIGTFKDYPETMKKGQVIEALHYAVQKLEARES